MRALVWMLIFTSSVAHAGSRLLALDDVYDCAFADSGTLVAATAGGLRIGVRVVTALDGLPETHVERVRVDGDTILATTRVGTATVSIASGLVVHADTVAYTPALPETFERYEAGIVRARARRGSRTCIATSDGLFVSDGTRTERIGTTTLPTGDVAAIAAGPRGLFIGTFDRGLFLFDGVHVSAVAEPIPNINALAWDSAHEVLWVATARGLVRCAGARAESCRRIGDRRAKHALLLVAGGVVAGGDEALYFFDGEGRITGSATRKGGARFRSVWSLAEHDGMLYVGTTSGLFVGTQMAFTSAPETLRRVSMVSGALPDDWITALLFHGDELVVGTYDAGVVTLEVGALTARASDPTLGYVNAGGLAALADGSLAVCTMDGLRVGTLGHFSSPRALGHDVTAVIPLVRDGVSSLWVATRRGVALSAL